jgi:hypothetical protein
VSAYQRVAAFVKIGQAKIGGNVASYFCTPQGEVLHLVAGPVSAHRLLHEARWANDTYQQAQLENQAHGAQLRAFFRKAHLQRLQNEQFVQIAAEKLPDEPNVTVGSVGELLDQNGQLSAPAKVHLLLAVAPLARIEHVYQGVFEKILNEKVSTQPVAAAR